MEEALEKIRDFADNAHDGQMRKYTPERYIVHPVRVMEACMEYNATRPILAAALLHDVLEDTPVTASEMLEFLQGVMDDEEARQTLLLVEELTDVYVWKDYPHWNRRKRKEKELERILLTSPEAQTIKYADMLDNSREIAVEDPDFAKRYLRECLAVLKKADKGHAGLRSKVLGEVRDCLNKVLGR